MSLNPETYTAQLAKARELHANDIAAVSAVANALGGDLDIEEIVAVLIELGWTPPGATP